MVNIERMIFEGKKILFVEEFSLDGKMKFFEYEYLNVNFVLDKLMLNMNVNYFFIIREKD